jgi:predicted component of type VI protein secretion system
MELTLNFKKLSKGLQRAQSVETAPMPPLSGGVWYLTERVAYPCFADAPLTLGELDFSRFTEDDLWALQDSLNTRDDDRMEGFARVWKAGAEAKPKRIGKRIFF